MPSSTSSAARVRFKINFVVFRFDDMETADWEPDRRTVTVRMRRSAATGRLGVKISHTPSGIYVDTVEADTAAGTATRGPRLCRGDRLLAVNGRSIEQLGRKLGEN
jgi:hypothetical protein